MAYALSTITILLSSIILFFALNKSYRLQESLADIYVPSTALLQKLSYQITETKMLIKNWVFVSPQTNSPDKLRLKELHEKEIPQIIDELKVLSKDWEAKEIKMLYTIEAHFKTDLIPSQQEVMNLLKDFEDYNNAMQVFSAQSLVEDESDPVMIVTTNLIEEINTFLFQLSLKSENVKIQSKKSMDAFKILIVFIAISIGFGTFLVASFTNRAIIRPIKDLDKAASRVQHGELTIQVNVKQEDEIGSLGRNFNKMISSLKTQKEELEEYNLLLIESQKELKETNKTKDKFFNIIAHDLKGPFTSFITITDILTNDPQSLSEDKKKYFLQSLNESALTLESLLENLLQWARTQSGTLEVNAKCVNLYNMAKQIVKLQEINARSNQIKIINNIEEQEEAKADPNLLHTILRNLMNNAVKFSDSDGQVILSSRNIDDKNIEISIQDKGIGIAEEDLPKLFRIDVNTKTIGESTKKGTGFGLILVKEFVEKQGGSINVSSQLGKGSVFKFTLPKC
jgi:signal transduction histidine kinase